MPYDFMCSNVGCGRLGPEGSCKECGWPMRALQRVAPPVRVPDSESSDPEFDADPDDGGD
jgi:hypothetical protein